MTTIDLHHHVTSLRTRIERWRMARERKFLADGLDPRQPFCALPLHKAYPVTTRSGSRESDGTLLI